MSQATFSSEPAEPTTSDAPLSFASWPTSEPTAPAAPDTNTASPSLNDATSSSPAYAVMPGMPSTPRLADNETPSTFAAGWACEAGSTAISRQPRPCTTWSPTAMSGEFDSMTSPTAPPARGSPIWNGGTYDFTSFIRPRMYGSTDMNRLATTISPS